MKAKIGLETHVQLNMQSKIFCGCRNPVNLDYEPEPNTLTCPTCLGMPGSKPRTNRGVIGSALKLALALNCKVEKEMFFSRKTYFYPDMNKNFQITQYEIPLGKNGHVTIKIDGKAKKIGIMRVHMEEDPAKLVHIGGLGGKYTLVDYNRAGIPLVEVVTDPDFSSPMEARLFLQKLAGILEYLGLYDPMSRAVFKSDANVSLEGGARIEVKNITGTKEIEQALKYEIVRQGNLLKRGVKVKRETRAWNPDTSATQPLRGKEEEAEYGYIFEPDLTRIEIGRKEVDATRKQLPELPDGKMKRFIAEFKIQGKLAESLVSDPEIARFFESVSKKIGSKLAASWIAGPLKKTLNYNGVKLSKTGIRDAWFVDLLKMFGKGELTDRNTELIIRYMVTEGKGPKDVMEKHEIGRVIKLNVSEHLKIVDSVIAKNKSAVKDYKSGENKALHFLVGQVMKESKGTIDPKTAREMLEKKFK